MSKKLEIAYASIDVDKNRPTFKWDGELKKLANKVGDIIRKKEKTESETRYFETAS